MKTIQKKVLLGATTILAMGVGAQTVEAATDSVSIQAIILDPVQITATEVLNFGSLTATTAGTVALDNADTLTPSAGITSVGGTITSGGFTLKGSTGRAIDVTAPASVNIACGADTMSVSAFTVDGGGVDINATAFTRSLAAATETGFKLGGTLNVGAAQAAGTYTGSVTLTANYQ